MVKLVDAVKRYSGEGDVIAWVERFEMVWELQADTMKETNQAKVLPLFLEGAAYDVFAQMEQEVRQDATRLKAGLQAAFGMSPLLAYAKFKARELAVGEAPTAFLAALRRLARAIEVGDGKALEPIVLCQFVDGMPEPTRSQLQALKGGSNWKIAEVLQCAQGLLQQNNIGLARGLLGRKVTIEHQHQGRNVEPALTSSGTVGNWQTEVRGNSRDGTGVCCEGCFRFGHCQQDCRV